MIDRFLYIGYVVYSKYIYDITPESTSILTFTFSISIGIHLSIEIFCAKYCMGHLSLFRLPIVTYIGVLINYLLYVKYTKHGRFSIIKKTKPFFRGSYKLSLLIWIVFTLFFISALMLTPIIYSSISDKSNCR
jgi:hypothetical protein